MALPKVQVLHCRVDDLQRQLESLVDDFAIIQTYYYPRGEELWVVQVLGRIKSGGIATPMPVNNFRPR